MAIGRLSMKVGKTGKAGPHAAYIAREGQYANRLERGERLEATECGNMPDWAAGQPQAFWQAADAFERSNGTTYREMEIALPREMDTEQRIALAREWVKQEVGDSHAYQWAIHVPTAADGGEQPHLHLMFSERQRDGIERDPEQYFKRYNAKAPEKGGARKGYGPNAGQTLSRSERAADLVALRGRWEAMANQHLEHAGIEARIDMRSHADRGLEYAPEAKKLPSQWRDQEQRGQVLEFRAARIEQQRAMAELGQVVPDLKGELTAQIIDIRTAAVARQEKAHAGAPEKPQVAQKATGRGEEALPASARIRRLLADLQDLRAEREESPRQAAEATQRPAPAPAVPVDPQRLAAVVERDSQVWQARQKLEPLERDRQQLQHQEQLTARAVEAWRTAHPWRAKMHDSGAMKSVELERLAQQMEATRERIEQHKPVLEQAKAALQQARAEAEPHALVVLQEQDRETRGYLEHELAKQREADAGGPRRDGPGPSMD